MFAVKVDGKSSTQELPTFTKTRPLAVNFLNWLQSTAGGGKTKQHSEQLLSLVLKFLKAVMKMQKVRRLMGRQ